MPKSMLDELIADFPDNGEMHPTPSRLTHWELSSTGNHIVRDWNDDVLCTVYEKPPGLWRVVVNVDAPYIGRQPHFSDKHFFDSESAKDHAETLLSIRHELEPTPTGSRSCVTEWHQQAKKENGTPTYGRSFGHHSASVKRAKSGYWFYVTYSGANYDSPVGWFATADEAMAACDARKS